MSATQFPIFTIGHSNHSLVEFAKLLLEHRIDVVADVRSSPYSRYVPHFNRDTLKTHLRDCTGGAIGYQFLGDQLGGRPLDNSLYDSEGRVVFTRLADEYSFDIGLRRIIHNADEHRIALMCSEKDPIECHRTILIAEALLERSVAVEHIHADGSLEDQRAAMDRLLSKFKLPLNGDLFRSRDDVITEALAMQARKIAYVAEGRAAYQGSRQAVS